MHLSAQSCAVIGIDDVMCRVKELERKEDTITLGIGNNFILNGVIIPILVKLRFY